MSIFNDNITNKVRGEELMKKAAKIVGKVVDRELCHYNFYYNHLKIEILHEFALNNMLFKSSVKTELQIYSKVTSVEVSLSEQVTKRGIPIYKVSIYTIDWIDDEHTGYCTPHLIDLYASVGGIVHGLV